MRFGTIRVYSSSVRNRCIYSKEMFWIRHGSINNFMISNEEIEDIMKIVKSLKESGILIKDVNEKIEHEAK